MKQDREYLEMLRLIITSELPTTKQAKMIEILRQLRHGIETTQRKKVLGELKEMLANYN